MRHLDANGVADALESNANPNPLGIAPGNVVQWSFGPHVFTAVMTTEDGINSGRPRWMIACTTCLELLHEATTGPVQNAEAHVRHKERKGG